MKQQKTWTSLARIFLSVLALSLLLRAVGGRQVWDVLRAADLRLLALAWLLFLLGIVIRSFRWQALLRGLDVHPPLRRLLKLYFVGAFFNAFLPSGFGGDVVRVVELAQDEQHTAVVGTVLVDRMTGILSQMVIGLLVLPFVPNLPTWLVWGFVTIALGSLVAGFLLLEGKILRRLTHHLPKTLSLAGEGILAKVYAAVTGSGWRAVWIALGLSTLFNLINILLTWLCGLAVGLTVNLEFYFVAVPLLSLTLLLPISVGGLGARDWVAQPLFGSVGEADAFIAGMTLSVAIVTAAGGLVGGGIYLWAGLSGLIRPHNSSEG